MKWSGISQLTDVFSGGTKIRFFFKAREIQCIKVCFVPYTTTGEQPIPSSGWILCLWFSSETNQEAHSGSTGSPNLVAKRYKMKTGSESQMTERPYSHSSLKGVCASSPDIATKCRTGLFRPG